MFRHNFDNKHLFFRHINIFEQKKRDHQFKNTFYNKRVQHPAEIYLNKIQQNKARYFHPLHKFYFAHSNEKLS
jgi:hypothetical protein